MRLLDLYRAAFVAAAFLEPLRYAGMIETAKVIFVPRLVTSKTFRRVH